ncbi:Fe-S-containing protein [Parasporobacterium paucivorans]|uniref:Predicted membrane protein n=1 Tax=Parasporobacterium paucivorans DSM 15970 TaxID=1122934 RepID=A0A1M6E140_9FIRM|nr:Fe-S-containing protein [Parasporobacterium paucivorans]SHI79222.1 Predicted membrane protein [Parasporobacterium paucivorans DSM 15970]
MFFKNKKRFISVLASMAAIVMVLALAGCSTQKKIAGTDETLITQQPGNLQSSKAPDSSDDTGLVIPTSEISETVKFYPVEIDGTAMEVIAVKAPDGTIRTAFNTCQVCYDSGRGYYKQEGNVLVCQNCGNRFKMDRVEVESGGCNPWPIFDENKTVTDDTITISADFLKESKDIFANWK